MNANISRSTMMRSTSSGVWEGDIPVKFALPLLALQISLVIFLTRSLRALLRPLRQPGVVAEIIGGILLGPTALGYVPHFRETFFPEQSITLMETFADIGLLYFMFMVGLELDLNLLCQTGKEAVVMAAAGISLPFMAGVGVSFYLKQTIQKSGELGPFILFMGVAMSITAFPVLARILAERKLLTTDVGQIAMSAAAVNDVVAWVLLAIAVALSGSDTRPLIAVWVFLSAIGFVILMFTVVKPLIGWLSCQTLGNDHVDELHLCIIFVGVLLSGFATDAIGVHAIFGAFIFGLIIPKNGQFSRILTERIEDFISILMLPLYFVVSGLRTNIIGALHGGRFFYNLIIAVGAACIGKVLGTFLVALAYKNPPRKALTLGFLMNTKGLVELIVLNIGRDRKVLNNETFTVLVSMALLTTFMTTPMVMFLYKPARNQAPYTLRAVELVKPQDELRILSCVHGIRNVPSIINLVEASRGLRKCKLRLFIMHLMEITERSSSIMMVSRARKDGWPIDNSLNLDNVLVAFEAYGQLSKVIVRPMMAISNFEDMHEDICNTASEKRASLILLPFHKYQRQDGTMDISNLGFRTVNKNVLHHAPCTVGILVDKCVLGSLPLPPSNVDHRVAVLFFGGADDREALVLGCRMAEHPGIKLTVIRFLQSSSHVRVNIAVQGNAGYFSDQMIESKPLSNRYEFVPISVDLNDEKQLDENCLNRVHDINADIEDPDGAIAFQECVVGDPYSAISNIGHHPNFDLLLVGSGRCGAPSLVLDLAGKQVPENPELGPIGDALASSPLIKASVLVVQRHNSSLE